MKLCLLHNVDFKNIIANTNMKIYLISCRLIDLTTRHRAETEMEVDRCRSAQSSAEKTLESRERVHRQKVKGLEEQVATLKDQLAQEMKKRQQYIRYVHVHVLLSMSQNICNK